MTEYSVTNFPHIKKLYNTYYNQIWKTVNLLEILSLRTYWERIIVASFFYKYL